MCRKRNERVKGQLQVTYSLPLHTLRKQNKKQKYTQSVDYNAHPPEKKKPQQNIKKSISGCTLFLNAPRMSTATWSEENRNLPSKYFFSACTDLYLGTRR